MFKYEEKYRGNTCTHKVTISIFSHAFLIYSSHEKGAGSSRRHRVRYSNITILEYVYSLIYRVSQKVII